MAVCGGRTYCGAILAQLAHLGADRRSVLTDPGRPTLPARAQRVQDVPLSTFDQPT
jgi:hypothetical protein